MDIVIISPLHFSISGNLEGEWLLRSEVEYGKFLRYLDPNITPLFISVIFSILSSLYHLSASYFYSLVDLPSPLHDIVLLIFHFFFYKSLSSRLYSLIIFPSSSFQYLPTSEEISLLLPYPQLALDIFHKFLHLLFFLNFVPPNIRHSCLPFLCFFI